MTRLSYWYNFLSHTLLHTGPVWCDFDQVKKDASSTASFFQQQRVRCFWEAPQVRGEGNTVGLQHLTLKSSGLIPSHDYQAQHGGEGHLPWICKNPVKEPSQRLRCFNRAHELCCTCSSSLISMQRCKVASFFIPTQSMGHIHPSKKLFH